MRMRNVLSLVAAFVLAALALSACGGSSSSSSGGSGGGTTTAASSGGSGPSGTLNLGTVIQLDNWNTLVKSGETYTAIPYESLLKVAPDGYTIQPYLATAWHQTPKRLDLTLRSGVVFHDGTPFDAQAVKQNIAWIQRSGSQWAAALAPIKQVVVKDPTHVSFLLSRQAPTLLENLTARGTFMVSPKEIATGRFDREDGTGPWTYDAAASQLGTKEVFHYFPRYWAPQNVGVKDIVMSVLQDPNTALSSLETGKVAATDLDAATLSAAQSAGMRVQATPTLIQHVLFLDRSRTFANENVRKAICSAIDPSAWVAAGLGGYGRPVAQRFPPGQPGYNASVTAYPHDLAAARRYMAAAGNPRISFTLPTWATNDAYSTLFAQELGQIGINVKLQKMDSGQYFTYYQSDKYPLQINTSASENTGPYDYYAFRFGPTGTGNPFHVKVPALAALAARALAETDPAAQNRIWSDMTQYIHDHALDCGFFQQDSAWAYDPHKLAGLPTTYLRPSAMRYHEIRLLGAAG